MSELNVEDLVLPDVDTPEGQNLVRRLRKMRQDGFTLIELLVVITILGILAAITVFSVAGINDKGQTAACKTDTATIQTAQEAYFAKNNGYAANLQALITAGFLSTGSSLHEVTTNAADIVDATKFSVVATVPTTPWYKVYAKSVAAPATAPCGGPVSATLLGAFVDGTAVL